MYSRPLQSPNRIKPHIVLPSFCSLGTERKVLLIIMVRNRNAKPHLSTGAEGPKSLACRTLGMTPDGHLDLSLGSGAQQSRQSSLDRPSAVLVVTASRGGRPRMDQ
ncbi:uncharacterized protein PGTG_20129 [Puccinia graminis f. sp. tritici CRL 75-36-700-3]|uniref:Uncharacterized protein n=1 Tax=Puccinia graminis f. sp. tritici (strain CRL 75-36-700-3 / race SCCL) TaxID=418459 RepID=E3LC30_PUCGT|nr:uncharacterized protein PGTG_20129 [Puccinia graminis f. sp. tritici CRL 75-36-700-3]EFP94105.1 hypothetical protein PGTG_20129 [Puccinia graminis f. sp. tritici CRL 75-36-700-3]